MEKVDIKDLCFLRMISNNEFAIKKVKKDEKLSLKNFKVPNYIIEINEGAFSKCKNLETLEFSTSVKKINVNAFCECISLEKVYYDGTIEDWCNIEFIDDCSNPMYYANHFYMKDTNNEYKEVTEIEIPKTITKIGNNQFLGFSNVTKINIPDSVTSIESLAFFKCINLTSIEIPSSITCINKYAFSYCTSLKNIKIPSSIRSINMNAFSYCTSLKNIKIPSSIRSINMNAFSYCTSLKNIEIPSSVESIGYYAFKGCSNLKSINVNKNNKKYVSIDGNLYSYDQKNLMQYALGKSNTSIEIPNSVTNIESFAFKGCSSLKSVTFEKGSQLTRIGEHAFYGCSSLTNIEIPSSIMSIGEYAFLDCCRLLTIINNSDLKLNFDDDNGCIAWYAYKIINKDGSVTYREEDNYTYIETEDDFLFRYDSDNNYQLVAYLGTEDTVTLPKDINGDSYEIYFMKGVKNVIIPDNFTTIGENAFNCCESLASIEIPNSVTSIGDDAFQYCQNLTSIKIPKSVTSIGDGAFFICESLTSIEIPNSVTSIGESAFTHCRNLTIYCETKSKPELWNIDLNNCDFKVIWNYAGIKK